MRKLSNKQKRKIAILILNIIGLALSTVIMCNERVKADNVDIHNVKADTVVCDVKFDLTDKQKAEMIKNSSVKTSAPKVKEEINKSYSENDLMLLAKVINAEAGSVSDKHQQLVGCVVMNRVNSANFPNSIHDVVYQKPTQYACAWDNSFKKKVSDRALKNAKLVLEGKIKSPYNLVWQAEFKQGNKVYKKFRTKVGKNKYSTTYFCTSNNIKVNEKEK